MAEQHRTERYLTAYDLSERLLPDLKMNEFLLWSPDLFAFTSYILSHTGAYQLVVSPPRGKKWYPRNYEIKVWFDRKNVEENVFVWLEDLFLDWQPEDDIIRVRKEITEKVKTEYNQIKNEFADDLKSGWIKLVNTISEDWRKNLAKTQETELKIIDAEIKSTELEIIEQEALERHKKLLKIILDNTPPLLIAIWSIFYNQINGLTQQNVKSPELQKRLAISELLCNMDGDIDEEKWKLSELLLTMHAISDLTCLGWGIRTPPENEKNAQEFAETLLFTKGSLSTINPQRCRIMPKRHNPELGITLRSVSSNLAFHRSSVDVVWRRAKNNPLVDRLSDPTPRKGEIISILLIPHPFTVETKDFSEDKGNKVLEFPKKDADKESPYGFFKYEPNDTTFDEIEKIIENANKEFPISDDKDRDKNLIPQNVDIIIFPETALSVKQEEHLTKQKDSILEKFAINDKKITSLVVAGVREEKLDGGNFSRNVVYSKYYDDKGNENYIDQDGKTIKIPPGFGNLSETLKKDENPKYKQHKHHRWKLTDSQIKQFGLSMVLPHKKIWWESTKVPRRRVSFLNVGEKITICNLICEDLARQDPIADLIRHVGPSLVITILMDGPQTSDRWASRYATVLSDDPGSSVITLTSFGMVRRYSSPFNKMSRVVAMWSEKDKRPREIELEQGARGILLTIEVVSENERTADGREETVPTSVLRLLDVIQVYPPQR
jgi:hypothetical protein